jgi:hypothetical protein
VEIFSREVKGGFLGLRGGRNSRKEGRKEGEMEKMFGPAYTGDPGVPHSDKDAFSSIFWGSVAFSAYSIVCPYYWEQCNNTFNWHDHAMVCENHQWKRARKQGKPYEFKWNKFMNKEQCEAYYHNWRDYFP